MRIIYIIDLLRGDGTQVFLNRLSRRPNEKGGIQEVICLNASFDKDIVDWLNEQWLKVKFIGKLSLLSGFGLHSICKQIRLKKPTTVIHSSSILKSRFHLLGIFRTGVRHVQRSLDRCGFTCNQG